MSVMPWFRIIGIATASRALAVARTARRALSPAACASASRARSRRTERRTTVRHTRCAFAAASEPVDDRDEVGVELLARPRPAAERAAPTPSSAGGGRRAPVGVAVVRQRVEVPAGSPTEHPDQRRLAQPRDLADRRVTRWSWSLAAVTSPTPQSRSTGSGCRNASSPSTGTTSRPSGFGPRWPPSRGLRPSDPHRDGQADAFEDRLPKPHGDLRRRARDQPQSAHVEERLVDRQPLDERRRVVEHLEQCRARLAVRRTSEVARRPPAGTAEEPASRPSACGRRTPSPHSWPRAPPRRRR